MNSKEKTNYSKSFQDAYEELIAPKLKKINMFLKTKKPPYNIKEVSQLLSISLEEINGIMKKENIDEINSYTFYIIMNNGSSGICRLFKRELERGTPKTYTAYDISYIYNIKIENVINACEELGIKEINSFTLPFIFSYMPARQIL